MPFAAALSEHPDAATAVGEVAGRILEQLAEAPDVALLFATPAHAGALHDIVAALRQLLDPAVLVGCLAASVVGTDREDEQRPGISVWAAVTGGAAAVHVAATPTGDNEVELHGWPDGDQLGFPPSAVIAIADPYTFPAEAFLAFVDEHSPGLPVFGGLASAPGRSTLVLDGSVHSTGAVVLFLGPGVTVEPVVSQGCRPIGDAWSVTETGGESVIRALGGKPPMVRLNELAADSLTDDEIALVNAGGLHLGRVIDEHKADFDRGDFLVRNIVGADRATGALAIGDRVEVGTTVQFHLRDAVAADEDLHALLRGRRADAALLFTCNGRGTHTFGVADHDAAVVSDELDAIPVGGFFAAGEFGPVGGRNFLHGFTASIALIRDDHRPG